MKSVRTLLASSVAAALGTLLLVGGSGSLAFWSDAATSATQQIQSGTLDLGSSSEIVSAGATIKQCATAGCTAAVAYTGGPLVPGDVVTTTVKVPVELVGQNLKAQFSVTPSKTASSAAADVALRDAVSIAIVSVNGAAASAPATVTLTPSQVAGGVVPVVIDVTFPWGTADQYNSAMGGTVSFGATYSLSQIAAG